jgi:hypothetical protein
MQNMQLLSYLKNHINSIAYREYGIYKGFLQVSGKLKILSFVRLDTSEKSAPVLGLLPERLVSDH